MVDGFNNRRLLEPIGNVPPAEAAYYGSPWGSPGAALEVPTAIAA